MNHKVINIRRSSLFGSLKNTNLLQFLKVQS